MSARVPVGSPHGHGCTSCEDRAPWRFLCDYHEGDADGFGRGLEHGTAVSRALVEAAEQVGLDLEAVAGHLRAGDFPNKLGLADRLDGFANRLREAT
jgi:hypothetical protein